MRISMGPVWPGPASASFRPAGGAWTAPQELLASGMRPQVAINAGGDSVAISQSGPGGLGASFRPAGGSAFDADWPATLSRGAHMSQAVGLDDAGNAVAVDSATAPDPAPGISAVIRPPAGCFGEEVDVSPRGVAVGRAALALRGGGTGAVAWASEEGGRWNVNLAELRLAPGGRTECPPGTPARPRPQAPAAPLPATKLSVSATPTRVSRRTLWREGLRFRVRAAKGSPVGAAIMPEGQLLTKLAHVRGRTGRRGLASLRVRVKRSVAATLPRGAKLELWVYAAAPGHQVAGKIRKLTVR
jgi:hypothetical protein